MDCRVIQREHARSLSSGARSRDPLAPLPGKHDMLQRIVAARIKNRWAAIVPPADPVNWSETSPICGSSEKFMVTIACGLTKCIRIKVMSVSPSTVVGSDALAAGARIMTRIQTALPVAAAIRVDVVITLSRPCGPLATTWSIVVAAIGLRAANAVRPLRGRGAVAATIFER